MRRASFAWTCLALFGCSAVVNPDENRLGEPVDAGRPAPVLMDAGDDRDAGEPGGPCEGRPRCDGDTLLTCTAGSPADVDCQAMSRFCEAGACMPHRCSPGGTRCVEGDSVSCDDRGSASSVDECGDPGCDDDTGRCRDDVPPPTCEGAERIEIGDDDEVDLCDRTDDATYESGGDCGMSEADAGDQVYVLTVESRREVIIQATDVDEDAAVDTVIYLRTSCDDMGSQIACGDDVPCETASLPDVVRCIRGEEVRQSRIRTTLEAGTYYLVVDAHDYTASSVNYDCGRVRVEVRTVSSGGGGGG